MTVLTMPVAVLVAVMVAPGIKAPVESETVPPTVALLVCANAYADRHRHSKVTGTKSLFMISPLPNSSLRRRIRGCFLKHLKFGADYRIPGHKKAQNSQTALVIPVPFCGYSSWFKIWNNREPTPR